MCWLAVCRVDREFAARRHRCWWLLRRCYLQLSHSTMNLRVALVGLLASSAVAFSLKKLSLPGSPMTSSVSSSPLWRPPMNMVAGGAERAYGDEYYDGMFD